MTHTVWVIPYEYHWKLPAGSVSVALEHFSIFLLKKALKWFTSSPITSLTAPTGLPQFIMQSFTAFTGTVKPKLILILQIRLLKKITHRQFLGTLHYIQTYWQLNSWVISKKSYRTTHIIEATDITHPMEPFDILTDLQYGSQGTDRRAHNFILIWACKLQVKAYL